MAPLRVGIVGIGNISGIYLKNLSLYRSTTVVAVADLERERAEAAAKEHNVPNVLSPDELIESPEVDLVLNLTIPAAHGPVALQAVKAGKHVYNEKPLSVTLEQAQELIWTAKTNGVLVGCAPDTFLGAGIQTCREVIDRGDIGKPVAGQAFMLSRGPEPWHPSPDFFFKPGGGPMLDMGPYYLTALVNLLGPIKRTTGISAASFETRIVGSGPRKGDMITVETPTHVSGVIEFQQGTVCEITTSFDVHFGYLPPITIYGSDGTLRVGDPNQFGDAVEIRTPGDSDWKPVKLERPFSQNSRGIGVLDMAHAIQSGRAHRASGDLACHVLETMLSFTKSSVEGRHQMIATPVERPAALSADEFKDDVPVGAV
ncbi:MAG TPA: Gfo/Idh/MocA family oxidoreductase [Fimbriimonas sp.]|nr:Gfo/Idh/MocA family oxidoreductase [Fimbriimonas sp.]